MSEENTADSIAKPEGSGEGNGSDGSGGSGAPIGGVAIVTQPPRAADLKVSTLIWPESPSAGDTFTATITIENRFTERVHIKNVEAVLPAELSVELNPVGNFTVLGWLKGLMRRIVTPAWYMPPSTIQILDALQVRQEVAAVSNYLGYETGPLVLSPGSSEVLNVPLRTKKWMFSAPRKHKLDISIDYELLPAGRSFYEKYGFRKVGSHLHEETGHTLLRLKL